MIYSIDRLQQDVMARLGEISQPQPPLSVCNIPTLADIVAHKVRSLLPEVGATLIRGASPDVLGMGCQLAVAVSMRLMPCGMYAAEVPLPEDFLRLVSVKMSGWERSVSRLILPESPEWECQWSGEAGIAGCPERPRAYIEGGILRALGSLDEDDVLEHIRCWRLPEPDSEGKFHFPETLYPELVDGIISKNLAIS